jgi:hypothetical protein
VGRTQGPLIQRLANETLISDILQVAGFNVGELFGE